MARKETTIDPTVQRTMDTEEDQVPAVDPDSSKVTDVAQDGPSLVDGHGEIVEEVPGTDPESDITPLADPGDLSAFGRSSMLPDDIGVADDAGFGGPVDPGTGLGSTLLDDLAGDLSDPSDGFGGVSDGSGSGVLDDQRGFAMSPPSGLEEQMEAPSPHISSTMYFDALEPLYEGASDAYNAGDDVTGDSLTSWALVTAATGTNEQTDELEQGINELIDELDESGSDDEAESQGGSSGGDDGDEAESQGGSSGDDGDEAESQGGSSGDGGDEREGQAGSSGGDDDDGGKTESQGGSGGDDDDDDETESQSGSAHGGSGDGPRESQTMPAPDDGTGGDPDESDFIGGRGDVDPAPETEDHGGAGALDTVAAGLGAVDPAPETEDHGGAGALDMERLGLGAVDPLEGETTLLGDDTGDLADMAAETDLVVIALEVDDSLVDADIGEDV